MLRSGWLCVAIGMVVPVDSAGHEGIVIFAADIELPRAAGGGELRVREYVYSPLRAAEAVGMAKRGDKVRALLDGLV